MLCDVRYCPSVWCYQGGMQCAVLSTRMVLPGESASFSRGVCTAECAQRYHPTMVARDGTVQGALCASVW
eukprot:2158206-Rhodomonas_salina.2